MKENLKYEIKFKNRMHRDPDKFEIHILQPICIVVTSTDRSLIQLSDFDRIQINGLQLETSAVR